MRAFKAGLQIPSIEMRIDLNGQIKKLIYDLNILR